jgi:hypothetical protein
VRVAYCIQGIADVSHLQNKEPYPGFPPEPTVGAPAIITDPAYRIRDWTTPFCGRIDLAKGPYFQPNHLIPIQSVFRPQVQAGQSRTAVWQWQGSPRD